MDRWKLELAIVLISLGTFVGYHLWLFVIHDWFHPGGLHSAWAMGRKVRGRGARRRATTTTTGGLLLGCRRRPSASFISPFEDGHNLPTRARARPGLNVSTALANKQTKHTPPAKKKKTLLLGARNRLHDLGDRRARRHQWDPVCAQLARRYHLYERAYRHLGDADRSGELDGAATTGERRRRKSGGGSGAHKPSPSPARLGKDLPAAPRGRQQRGGEDIRAGPSCRVLGSRCCAGKRAPLSAQERKRQPPTALLKKSTNNNRSCSTRSRPTASSSSLKTTPS